MINYIKPTYFLNKMIINNLRVISMISVFVLCISSFAYAQKSDFKAAVVKINITPVESKYLAGYGARKSKGVLDPIFHKILVLNDGLTEFVLISTDLGKIDPSVYDQMTERLNQQIEIEQKNIWWTVTHTHSAPEVGPPGLSKTFMPERYDQPMDSVYTDYVERKLIEGVIEARQNLEPAKLGVGWGYSQANINRRAIDIDGNASLGINPDGPVDHRIGLLRIDKEDGSPLALVANYPIHGTVLGSSHLEISGDAPGVVSEYVKNKIGAPVLFINGAAGDIAPIYSVYPDPESGHLGQFRVLLGDKILEANQKITSNSDVTLSTGSITVETPRKDGLGWPEDLSYYTRTNSTGTEMIRLPIRFLKINNDIAIWSAPLELFNEINNKIRAQSPFPYTFYFGYANGNLRYLVTESAYEEGGYEPNASPFSPSAERDLIESVNSYLHGQMSNPEY